MERITLKCNNREDWLEYRKPDITSTDTAALFGLSPYKTRFELYHKHASGIILPFTSNERVDKGNRMEAAIAHEAALQEGWTDLKPFKDYVRIPSERIGSSFDFEAIDKDGEPILVEIKMVDYFRYRDMWVDSQAPDHIEVQVAHELMLAGRFKRCAIVAWTGTYDCNVIYRERDPNMERGILTAIRKFWQDVDARNEPAPDFARDEDMIAALFRSLRPDPADMSDTSLDDKLTAYELARLQAKEFDDKAKALKAEIHFALGDVGEAFTNQYKIGAKWTKDSSGTLITDAMVGTSIGGRKGYRQLNLKRLNGGTK